MNRRALMSLLGGAATWPLAARAQQPGRRIGILMSLAADDWQGQARLAVFIQRLRELGWTEGHNVRIETRWAAGLTERGERNARRLGERLEGLKFAIHRPTDARRPHMRAGGFRQ